MKKLAASLSLLALISGCAAGATTDSKQDSEDVGAAEQAWFELACAQMSIPDATKGTVVGGTTPTNTCWKVYADSPDTTYGTNSCPVQFVVDFPLSQLPANLWDGNFTFGVEQLGYTANTQDACLKLNKTLAEYGRSGRFWLLMRSRAVRGKWNGSSPTQGYCSDEIVSDFVSPGVGGPRDYDELRFAVSAYTNEVIKGTTVVSPLRVELWAENDCI
jgi:hypothetical protein